MLTAAVPASPTVSSLDFTETPRPPRAPQVLLVAGDPAQRRMARRALERERYRIAEASNGEEALARCTHSLPDLILLDAVMPIMDGFQTCTRVRRLPGGDRVAILIVTGPDDAQAVDHALRAGATDFVTKPIHWGGLRRRVARLVQTAHTQARLNVTEARMRALVAGAPDGIVTCDNDGVILTCNPAAERLFRCAATSLIGRPLPAFVATADSGELFRDGSGRECIGNRPDGSTFPVEVSLSGFGDRDRRYYSAILRDITERKAAEQELRLVEQQFRQAQKMEAIGRLAGGIAHDFNNFLTAILGNGQMVLADLEPDSPLRAGLEQIKDAGERAAVLTRQLLAFSRQQVLVVKTLDLNLVVADFQKMLLRLIGEDIELTTSLAGDLGNIKADPGQIEQVLMNLAVNSRDAMPHGGRLTIETANVDVTGADAHFDLRPGAYVLLAVRDTGCGMDAATKARIFEPFFTTKEVGKGTGLGLATVYGIVHQSGGQITLESEPGQGATFRIYFPRVDDAITPLPLRTARIAADKGHETVLVVEDEPSVRTLVCQVLRRSGYTVLDAANAGEALTRTDPGPIDLLLTDMVMPGMSGRELADRLTVQQPGLKVLYMSGYVDPEGDEATLLKGRRPFLQKPFHPNALARQVRQVLDQ